MNQLTKTFLLAASLLAVTVMPGAALSTSYYASSSKLASGHWVKIKVSETGMHQITYDQLRQWGFSNPERVAVYGNGATRYNEHSFTVNNADDVKQTATLHTTDGRIIFYGEADFNIKVQSPDKISVTRNQASMDGFYLLSDVEGPASMSQQSYRYQSSAPASTHFHFEYREDDVQNPGKGGALYFGESFIPGVPQVQSFDMADFAVEGVERSSSSVLYDGYYRYDFKSRAPESTLMNVTYPEEWSFVSDPYNVASMIVAVSSKFFSRGYGYCKFQPNADLNPTLTGRFDVKLAVPATSAATFVALDFNYLYYPRYNRMADNSELKMYFLYANNSKNFCITDAPENVQVWNVTNNENIIRHITVSDRSSRTYTGTFNSTYNSTQGAACLIAFRTDMQHRPVQYVGQVNNQNIHGDETPDMVIITNNELYDEACELAETHRVYQGIKVNVYTQDQVFNEFSSATPHVMGYRRMMKMFYDRDPQKAKYLLLYGAGCYDNRGLQEPNRNYLLTFETDSYDEARGESTNYSADSYFGMMSDSYSHAEIYYEPMHVAVGRIPASNSSTARVVNSKIKRYIQNPPTAAQYNRAVLLSDDGDANVHFKQSLSVDSLLQVKNPNISTTGAHNLVYPWASDDAKQARDVISQALTQGQGYFSYTGHGNENYFTREYIWGKRYVEDVEYDNQPLAMLSTCDAFDFDRLSDGIGEKMLFKENGGMIGVIGACRTVYLAYNQSLNLGVAEAYASAAPGSTIGDVYRIGRNKTLDPLPEKDLAVNTMCYNLAGDPAIPLSIPAYSIKVSSINGVNTDAFAAANPMPDPKLDGNGEVVNQPDGARISAWPLSPFEVKGKIVDATGNVVTGFNGEIELSIYDGPYTTMTINQSVNRPDSTDPVLPVTLDQELLSITSAVVTNGEFTVVVTSPVPQVPDFANRMIANAISTDGRTYASGSYGRFVMRDYDASKVDADILTSAPVITQFYLDDASFANGDVLGSNVTVYAEVANSSSGISYSGMNIGSSTSLILDGKTSYSRIRSSMVSDAQGNVSIEMPIIRIPDGKHTLTLTVSDNAGNRDSRTIDFTVISYPTVSNLAVEESTVTESATFSLDHNFENEPVARLIIEDHQGNVVASTNNVTFPYTWNLKNHDNELVANGKYRAFSILSSNGTTFGSTPRVEFVVVKK